MLLRVKGNLRTPKAFPSSVPVSSLRLDHLELSNCTVCNVQCAPPLAIVHCTMYSVHLQTPDFRFQMWTTTATFQKKELLQCNECWEEDGVGYEWPTCNLSHAHCNRSSPMWKQLKTLNFVNTLSILCQYMLKRLPPMTFNFKRNLFPKCQVGSTLTSHGIVLFKRWWLCCHLDITLTNPSSHFYVPEKLDGTDSPLEWYDRCLLLLYAMQ